MTLSGRRFPQKEAAGLQSVKPNQLVGVGKPV